MAVDTTEFGSPGSQVAAPLLPQDAETMWGERRSPAPLASRPGSMIQSSQTFLPSRPSQSVLKPLQPLTHQLPQRVMWAITLQTAAAMACINFLEVFTIERATLWKFGCMQHVIEHAGLLFGWLALVLICMGFAVLGVISIELFAKNCGGSGLPENKCFLNGSSLPGFFTIRTLAVRVATSILANAAGFPVGREGPSVVIGSNVAYIICKHMLYATRHTEQWVEGGRNSVVLILDENRIAHASRIACAVGGACGIAMIFNSPIGGLLYMFEEITSVSWPWELTFHAFVATTFCTMFSYGMLYFCNKNIREFVIFAWERRIDSWGWIDVPWFVLLAASLGAVTSIHTRGCIWMTNWRKKQCFTGTCARVVETVIYSGLCASVTMLVSTLATCDSGHPGTNPWVQLNCKEGEYNPVATLLVNTSHSAVKLLFETSNDVDDFGPSATALSFAVYFLLNVGLCGLPVPGGAFTATMLLGAMLGRCVGCLIASQAPEELQTAHPGIYSVVGCAAMLCGFKQMTATVVLICVQCVNNLDVAPVVMLSVSVSMAVNRCINKHGHDEQQIKNKRLPFLESDVPEHLLGLSAADLCETTVSLQRSDSFQAAHRALITKASHFPVLCGDRCVGTVAREVLQAAVETRSVSFHAALAMPGENGEMEAPALPIFRFMDATPFTLQGSMPVERLWSLFSRGGEMAACVVSDTGNLIGVISRAGLLNASYRME